MNEKFCPNESTLDAFSPFEGKVFLSRHLILNPVLKTTVSAEIAGPGSRPFLRQNFENFANPWPRNDHDGSDDD